VRKVTLPKARPIKEKNGNETALLFQLCVRGAELRSIFPKLPVCRQDGDGELKSALATTSHLTVSQFASSQLLRPSPSLQQSRVLITENVTFALK